MPAGYSTVYYTHTTIALLSLCFFFHAAFLCWNCNFICTTYYALLLLLLLLVLLLLFSAKLLHSVLACLLFQCTRRGVLSSTRTTFAWRLLLCNSFFCSCFTSSCTRRACLFVSLFVCLSVCRLSVAYCCMQMLTRSSQHDDNEDDVVHL